MAWRQLIFSFIAWGGELNGLYQVLEAMLAPVKERAVQVFHLNQNSLGHKLFQIISTFVLVDSL